MVTGNISTGAAAIKEPPYVPDLNNRAKSPPFPPAADEEWGTRKIEDGARLKAAATKAKAKAPAGAALRADEATGKLLVRERMEIEIRGMGEINGQERILARLLPIGF
jgi:hypothetical protein